jgi:hypothetical protein
VNLQRRQLDLLRLQVVNAGEGIDLCSFRVEIRILLKHRVQLVLARLAAITRGLTQLERWWFTWRCLKQPAFACTGTFAPTRTGFAGSGGRIDTLEAPATPAVRRP